MIPGQLQIGDVVQIDPAHGLMWGGCFAFVKELKAWGAEVFVAIPEQQHQPPGEAYLRVRWEHMEWIGKAVFWPLDLVEQRDPDAQEWPP